MKNICVFFGGKSCEHDISIITGVLTLNCINSNLYNAVPIYISKSGKWYSCDILKDINCYKNIDNLKLQEVCMLSGKNSLFAIKKNKFQELFKIYSVINCLHGVNGEDGSISGLIKLCNVPNASPEMFGSSFSMDKDYTKIVLSGLNVDKLPYIRLFRPLFFQKKVATFKMIEKKFSYPVIIKPATLGSSIGISTAKNQQELDKALTLAFIYDDKVIIEKALENFREINCAAYRFKNQIKVSFLEEPIIKNDILSFKDKYLGSKMGVAKQIPANISPEIASKIKNITEKIYRKCDFKGVIRIDFLVKDTKVYVNEINTVPGSLANYLFSSSLKGFTDLLSEIIEESVCTFNYEQTRKYTFSSSVLFSFDGVKGSKQLTKKM